MNILRKFTGKIGEEEERQEEISFTIHRFSERTRPKPESVIIYPVFSEFGSEIVGTLYCIPQLNEIHKDKYKIAMGWYGRSYLYRHLVNEYWEINEKHQWLREWCRAFHHDSRNLREVEKMASEIGKVIPINEFAAIAGTPASKTCLVEGCDGEVIQGDDQRCQRCGASWRKAGLFHDVKKSVATALWPPLPSGESFKAIECYLKPNAVGISARARKCYGRNLPSIFYERLIYLLEDMGYNPVWIGEPATTLPCPLSRIPDFSRSNDAADLEKTLALVSKLKFTVQFWTASSRLAGLVGTPFLIVESPEQIWGYGQEGLRLCLCSKGERKLVVCHYRSFLERQTYGLKLVRRAVSEMEKKNYTDIIGMVENEDLVGRLRAGNQNRIGA